MYRDKARAEKWRSVGDVIADLVYDLEQAKGEVSDLTSALEDMTSERDQLLEEVNRVRALSQIWISGVP